jgi:type IV pilus assembly protein PilX
MKTSPLRPRSLRLPLRLRPARGVVLVFALIALLILMIGAVALVRSFNTSLTGSSSLGFKKDLVNRNEAAIAQVLRQARTAGSLIDANFSALPRPEINYSPQILDYDERGIPRLLLVSDADFNSSGIGRSTNDIPSRRPEDNIMLRYVIDRQCSGPGTAAALGASGCVTATPTTFGGSADVPIRAEMSTSGGSGSVPISPVYRLSVRAIGPKGTLAFYQTTFTLQ